MYRGLLKKQLIKIDDVYISNIIRIDSFQFDDFVLLNQYV